MTKIVKNVSVMCFHDELCQVYNALMTALSLLREGSKVTMFFGSRGINAVTRKRLRPNPVIRASRRQTGTR